MKKTMHFAAVAMVSIIVAASFAFANEGSQPTPGQGMGQQGGMQASQDPQAIADRKAEEELMLKNRKEEMLLRVNNQISRLDKDKACITAATSMDALHACQPSGGPGGRTQGGPGGGMQGGPGGGMQGGPGGGMQGGRQGQ